MGYCYLNVRNLRDVAMATKLCWVKRESNEGGLLPRALSARSPGGSTVMFRYYLLGGDIAAPSGLYARVATHFY